MHKINRKGQFLTLEIYVILAVVAVVLFIIFHDYIMRVLLPTIIGVAIIGTIGIIVKENPDFLEDKIPLTILVLFFMLGLGLALFPFLNGMPLSLVGLGQGYTISTKEYDITFNFAGSYYEKTGCQEACVNLDSCNLQSVITGQKAGCNLYECISPGIWQNCKALWGDTNVQYSRDQCQYGASCSPSEPKCKLSYSGCQWLPKDYGERGGPIAISQDNCAWYVIVKDKQGNTVKEYTALSEYGEGWDKGLYYRQQIDDNLNGTGIKYISDNYGITQRRTDGSTIKDCISVKFLVQDERYRYNICLGNDGIDGPDCTDVLTKDCKLQCPDNIHYDFNFDACSCTPKDNACMDDSECGTGKLCIEHNCQDRAPDNTSVTPPPVEESKLNFFQKLWLWILDFFKNVTWV